MSKEPINLKLNLEYIKLKSLTTKENTEKTQDVTRENSIEMTDWNIKGKKFKLIYKDEIISDSILNLVLEASIEVENDLNEEDFKKLRESDNLKSLAHPLLAESSHIISFITSKTDFLPLIVPPMLVDEEEEVD